MRRLRWILVPLAAAVACTSDGGKSTADTGASADGGSETGDEAGDDDGPGDERVQITHNFGAYELEPFEEVEPCVQWTLDNDEPIYLQMVQLANLGFFHHSNWFLVPEDKYEGPDGYFPCRDRGFTELDAAVSGTVLFAQSTQSYVEEQRTREGAVIKVPPRHKVVAGTHLLNVTPRRVPTDLWMTLELVHPRQVEVLLAPFRLSYIDLQIPPNAESRFTGRCLDMASKYEGPAGTPFNVKLHYVLPHFHYLGNYFRAEVSGGPDDGLQIIEVEGFNGEANGKTFDPPLDLSGAEGVTFTCGYDNWTDAEVGWGIGDQEMCVMLGLAEMDALMDVSVLSGTQAVGTTGDIIEFEGACGTIALPKNAAQSFPSQAEIDGPFYVPPIDPDDANIPPVPACVDTDESVGADLAPTLSNVRATVFQQSCSFNSCHGRASAIGNLDLEATDLHAELVGRASTGMPGMPLVDPGDPDNSWLYRKLSSCEPGAGSAMPRNAPVLLDDATVALVREWIEAGALDD